MKTLFMTYYILIQLVDSLFFFTLIIEKFKKDLICILRIRYFISILRAELIFWKKKKLKHIMFWFSQNLFYNYDGTP